MWFHSLFHQIWATLIQWKNKYLLMRAPMHNIFPANPMAFFLVCASFSPGYQTKRSGESGPLKNVDEMITGRMGLVNNNTACTTCTIGQLWNLSSLGRLEPAKYPQPRTNKMSIRFSANFLSSSLRGILQKGCSSNFHSKGL